MASLVLNVAHLFSPRLPPCFLPVNDLFSALTVVWDQTKTVEPDGQYLLLNLGRVVASLNEWIKH